MTLLMNLRRSLIHIDGPWESFVWLGTLGSEWQNGEITLGKSAEERVNKLLSRRAPTPSTEMAVSIHRACAASAKNDA
jgi:hypothetical protein